LISTLKYTNSRLQQKTKKQLIEIIMELTSRPDPEPKIIVKAVEKLIPVKEPVPTGWKLIPEAHITNIIRDYRDQLIKAIQSNERLPMTDRQVVEKIINHID